MHSTDGATSIERRKALKTMVLSTAGLVSSLVILTNSSQIPKLLAYSLSAPFANARIDSSVAPGFEGKYYGCCVTKPMNHTLSDAIGMKCVRARGWVGDTTISSAYPENIYRTTLIMDAVGVEKFAGTTNWTLLDWDDYCKALFNNQLSTSRPYVHSWEIGNEPQVASSRSGYLAADGTTAGVAKAYYNMLKNAWNINRSQRPYSNDQIMALGGAFIFEDFAIHSYYNQNIWLGSPAGQWVQSLWNVAGTIPNGLAPYCNAISIHGYSDKQYLLTDYPIQTSGYYKGTKSTHTLSQIWNNMLNAYRNLAGKPVMITETGFPMSATPNQNQEDGIPLSTTKQADFLNQAFNFYAGLSYIDSIFWYNLMGLSQQGTITWDFGLFSDTSPPTERPAAQTFATFANG